MTLKDQLKWFLNEERNTPDVWEKKAVELAQQSLKEIDRLTEAVQQTQANLNKTRDLLNTAAGLLMRLDNHGFINTGDDDDYRKEQLDHWRSIGHDVVKNAQKLLNQP